MFQKISAYISALALALTLTACATPGGQTGESTLRVEVGDRVARARVIEQTVGLRGEHLGLREVAFSQLGIRRGAPEEIRESRGELRARQRTAFFIG